MDARQPPPFYNMAPARITLQSPRAEPRRGPWSQDEDTLLMRLVKGMDKVENWVKISEMVRTRSAKQCRERYHQNLKPSLSHQPISQEEGDVILRLVDDIGPKWAEIARRLVNRSDNAVKNWYNGSKNRARRAQQKRYHQHRLGAHDSHHHRDRLQRQLNLRHHHQQLRAQHHHHHQQQGPASPPYTPQAYSYQPQPEYPAQKAAPPRQFPARECPPHHQYAPHEYGPEPYCYARDSRPQLPSVEPPSAQRPHVPVPIAIVPQSPSSAAYPRYSAAYDTPLPSPSSSLGFSSVSSSPHVRCGAYTYAPRPQTSGSISSSSPTDHAAANIWKIGGQCVLPPIKPRLSDEPLGPGNHPPTPRSPDNEAAVARPGPEPEPLQRNVMSLDNLLCD